MKLLSLNNLAEDTFNMAKKKLSKKSLIPKDMQKYVIVQEITHDFILELYEKSKSLPEKEKKELLKTAETLSKCVGQWLGE